MSKPGLDTQRHIDQLRDTLIERAIQTQRTITLDEIDDTHHVVQFQGACWSVQAKDSPRKRWFTPISHTFQYTFDIDFETLFLKPGKLILKQGHHPQTEDFKARRIKVEPILVQW